MAMVTSGALTEMSAEIDQLIDFEESSLQYRCQTTGGATWGATLQWLLQQRLHSRCIALQRGQFLM